MSARFMLSFQEFCVISDINLPGIDRVMFAVFKVFGISKADLDK